MLAGAGCDDPLAAGQPRERCGLSCDQSVANGDFAVTGVSSVDALLQGHGRLQEHGGQPRRWHRRRDRGPQADFGITPAELTAGGGLAGAIKAKLTASAKASIVVKAEPAKCEVDAHASFEASAELQG